MYNGNAILVADNDPQARYNLKLCLWQLDCTVHETENENEVITFIVTQSPKTVFISLEFTKTNNFYLLHKIKELSDCSLIVYADGFTREDLMCCIDASVNDVLLNPCTQLDRLRRIVAL